MSLLQLVKKAYSNALAAWHEYKYKKDYKKKKKVSYENKLPFLTRCESGQLFLVPHADDDLLGGYAISKLQKGNIVYGFYGLTGSNDDPKNKEIRDKEFILYTDMIDVPYRKISNIYDLRRIIEDLDIHVVYLPSIIDWHPEHRKLNYDLYTVLEELTPNYDLRIIWYCVTVPIRSGKSLLVPMTELEQAEKYNCFEKIYVSQRHMPINRFRIEERINALGTDSYAAEMCLPIALDDWKRIVTSYKVDEPTGESVRELEQLKNKLNNIIDITRASQTLYSKHME